VCELEVFDAGELLDDLAGFVEAIDGMRNAGRLFTRGGSLGAAQSSLPGSHHLAGVSVELGTISDAPALY
jgi:hypothetical protein